jgi:hypothetical protein
MTSVGNGVKVVEEPALAAKQRVVLDTGQRPAHPWRVLDPARHAANAGLWVGWSAIVLSDELERRLD